MSLSQRLSPTKNEKNAKKPRGRKKSKPAPVATVASRPVATESQPASESGTARLASRTTQPPAPLDRATARGRSVTRRRFSLLDRLGHYEMRVKGSPSTSRQYAGMLLASTPPPTTPRGTIWGIDEEANQPIFMDIFQAYEDEIISSPNGIVFGDIKMGKSSFLKSNIVMKNLAVGKRVVVIDKKPGVAGGTGTLGNIATESEGEYSLLARKLFNEPIKFRLGGGGRAGACINPMDPRIRVDGAEDEVGQLELLTVILAQVIDRDLNSHEQKVLAVAHETVLAETRAAGTVPLLGMLATRMLAPDPNVVDAQDGHWNAVDYANWGVEIGHALENLLRGSLAGLIGDETSANVSLDSGLTVFDISALPDDGPAVPIVMAIINTWLKATLFAETGKNVPTVLVVEEGWFTVVGRFAEVMRRNMKLSRGLGLGTWIAFQHPSDIPKDSPAMAAIREAGCHVNYGQAIKEDAEFAATISGLHESAVDTMMSLRSGSSIIRFGQEAPIRMRHIRSDEEIEITNTDAALTSTATIALAKETAKIEQTSDEPVGDVAPELV